MDEKTQELFDQIISKDQESLSNEEKGFLMARRGYLNDEQRKRYADMIKLHESGKLLPSEAGSLSEMSLKEIKALAKAEKIDITGLKTVEDIAEAIESARVEDEE